MKDIDELKKIAVLIDAENAQQSKLKSVIDEISAHGHIIVKRAYGDWSTDILRGWKDILNTLAIQPVQQFSYTTGKNSSDAKMIIDAMDLLYTKQFDAFVLVTSDSDFTSLATRLKQSEIFVFGVGENKTPVSFRNACDDFILTENLNKFTPVKIKQATQTSSIPNESPKKVTTKASTTNTEPKATGTKTSIKKEVTSKSTSPDEILPRTTLTEAIHPISLLEEHGALIIELLYKAWEIYHDENGYVNVSAAGQYIKRIQTDFDARTYGFTKLPELIQSLPNKFEMTRYKGSGTVNIVAYKPVDEKAELAAVECEES